MMLDDKDEFEPWINRLLRESQEYSEKKWREDSKRSLLLFEVCRQQRLLNFFLRIRKP